MTAVKTLRESRDCYNFKSI